MHVGLLLLASYPTLAACRIIRSLVVGLLVQAYASVRRPSLLGVARTQQESRLCFVDQHFYYWHGWDLQYKWIRELYANISLTDREPQAIWRGRVADDDYPERDALRCAHICLV